MARVPRPPITGPFLHVPLSHVHPSVYFWLCCKAASRLGTREDAACSRALSWYLETLLCAERSECRGEELPSSQGRDGWAVTYFNHIPGCCHEDASDCGVEGVCGVPPSFGEWKWGKRGFPQHLPMRTCGFAGTNTSSTRSLLHPKIPNPEALAQLADVADSPRGANSPVATCTTSPSVGFAPGCQGNRRCFPKTKGVCSGTRLLPCRRCCVVGIKHMNWKSTLEMAPQRGDGGVTQLEVVFNPQCAQPRGQGESAAGTRGTAPPVGMRRGPVARFAQTGAYIAKTES